MCVIAIGHKSTISNGLNFEDTLEEMLIANPDGFGCIYHSKGSEPKTIKTIDENFIYDNPEIIQAIKNSDTFVLHFRLATHGIIEDKQCHPFQVDENAWIVHNGVISGLGNDLVSDTYQLAEICSHLPMGETIRLLECFNASGNGKYTYIWYDKHADKLNTIAIGHFEKYYGLFVSNLNFLPRIQFAPINTPKMYHYDDYATSDDVFYGQRRIKPRAKQTKRSKLKLMRKYS